MRWVALVLLVAGCKGEKREQKPVVRDDAAVVHDAGIGAVAVADASPGMSATDAAQGSAPAPATDAGTTLGDAASPRDAATPIRDAAVPRDDAATPIRDAAVASDAAAPIRDAAIPRDAVTPIRDAAVARDAAVPIRDAAVPRDAARPDAGVATAPTPDAGVASTTPTPTPPLPSGPLVEPKLTKARELCITKGTGADGTHATIDAPAVRGFARGSTGDSATLTFTYRGLTDKVSELASGDVRAQLGLKLRAQNSCNVIYVMWRFAPKAEITVQVKANPGKQTHKDCGAAGYTRIKGTLRKKPPAVAEGSEHTLAAAISGDELAVWADHALVYKGTLPATARDIKGPAGFRTDNVKADVAISGPALASAIAKTECPKGQAED